MDNYDKQRQEYYDRKLRRNHQMLRLYFLACGAMLAIALLMYAFDL